MRTIGELIKLSGDYLAERKIDRPKRCAEEILMHVLQIKRLDLYLQFDKPVIESELIQVRELLKRCAKNEPLEYILGMVEFLGCQIEVSPSVLIPRPETEILVELVAKKAKKGVLWDLCTGSGCIGIALKKANPELSVSLCDLSSDALQVATNNAKRNGVDVTFCQGDLLAPMHGMKADFIVCNPPYISKSEFITLDPSVKDFEPKMALVGGERGTEFYERLARELPSFLNPGAQCFFEIGSTQGAAVKQIFSNRGEILCDWAGHPRFFFLENGN